MNAMPPAARPLSTTPAGASAPRNGPLAAGLDAAPPLLVADNLVKHYTLPRERLLAPAPVVEAVRGVSFAMQAGRSLGLVGESGSGKSTLARLVMALERPTAGRVQMLGRDLNALAPAALRAARADFQMVFQDPYGSLDPRLTVGRVVAEPLAVMPAADTRSRIAEALDAVGLRASDAAKYPHEFSGGQRQRIAIARALITRPRLIVADEPVSALDVSVQAQVLNLLQDLQQQFGVTYLLISHDIAVVDHLCEEVAVLYAGRIVEQGSPDVLFKSAAHPYTRALMAAVPEAGTFGRKPRRSAVARDAAASLKVGLERDDRTACAFAPRCPHRQPVCIEQTPPLRSVANGHVAACHFAEQVMKSEPTLEEETS